MLFRRLDAFNETDARENRSVCALDTLFGTVHDAEFQRIDVQFLREFIDDCL